MISSFRCFETRELNGLFNEVFTEYNLLKGLSYKMKFYPCAPGATATPVSEGAQYAFPWKCLLIALTYLRSCWGGSPPRPPSGPHFCPLLLSQRPGPERGADARPKTARGEALSPVAIRARDVAPCNPNQISARRRTERSLHAEERGQEWTNKE